jgi:hypothetical protein
VNEEKAVEQRYYDGRHLHDGGVLTAGVLRDDPKRESHQGATEGRHGNHQARLRRTQMEGLGIEGAHGAVQHPAGEAEVEVKKSGEKGARASPVGNAFIAMRRMTCYISTIPSLLRDTML